MSIAKRGAPLPSFEYFESLETGRRGSLKSLKEVVYFCSSPVGSLDLSSFLDFFSFFGFFSFFSFLGLTGPSSIMSTD